MAGKKKILLVDDELEFADMLKTRLEASKYSVISASTGEEALEMFGREKPNAVILDIMMPGVSGIDVLASIRKTDKKTPVFILTAYVNEERLKEANKLNASGFVLKTANLKEEVARINEAIELAEKYK